VFQNQKVELLLAILDEQVLGQVTIELSGFRDLRERREKQVRGDRTKEIASRSSLNGEFSHINSKNDSNRSKKSRGNRRMTKEPARGTRRREREKEREKRGQREREKERDLFVFFNSRYSSMFVSDE
jgi:hypothetical protein